MEHLIVIFFVLILMIGVITSTISTITYVIYQIEFFVSIVLNVLLMMFLVILQGLEVYVTVNHVVLNCIEDISRNGSWLIMSMMIVAIPKLIHQIFDLKTFEKRRSIIIVIATINVALMVVNTITFNRIWMNISLTCFYVMVAYCVYVIYSQRKSYLEKAKETVLNSYLVLFVILIPLLILDTQAEYIFDNTFIQAYGLLSLPIFFLLLNVLTIYWMQYLNKRMPELFRKNMEQNDSLESFYAKYSITQREKDVVGCLINGYSYEAIADSLGVSKSTIKTHIRNIYRKADVNNKVELMNIIYLK